MTKALRLALAGLAFVGMTLPSRADTVSPYTVDFKTEIDVTDHAFKVASNWKHVVDSYEEEDDYGWSETYYMTYSYSAKEGTDGLGALRCGRQELGSSWSYSYKSHDLLVTPLVNGDITLYAKQYDYYTGYVEFYAMNDDGSRGELIKKFSKTAEVDGDPVLSEDGYTAFTIHLDDFTRVGLRCSNVYIDDFSATEVDMVKEPALKLVSVKPTDTTGTLYWNQLPDGSVPITFTVKVMNTGEVDLTQDTPKYTISLIKTENNEVIGAPVRVPQDLKIGDTSDEFEATFIIEKDKLSSVIPYTYTGTKMSVRENISGSKVDRTNSTYREYANKFVFRNRGTYSSSSLSSAVSTGVIRSATGLNFEIANLKEAGAPLHIIAISVPEGFTATEIPAEGLDLQPDKKFDITVTSTAATPGVFSGNIEVKYDEIAKGTTKEITYTLPVSSVVITGNTWLADFNSTSSTPNYPEGSIAENGITSDYTYNNSYDHYLYSHTSSDYKTAENRFITPKLHAAAGDKLSFDVRLGSDNNSDIFVKVYASADRENWGEPLAEIRRDDLTSSWQTKSVTVDTEGDYYFAFAVYKVRLDNIVGLEMVSDIAHDVFYRKDNLHEEYQSGTQIEPSVTVIPALALKQGEYSVNFYVDGEVKASLAGTDVAASAKSDKEFRLSAWKPEVTATTEFTTHFEFNFTDGTKIATPSKKVKITYEPLFYFFNKGTQPGNYPSNRTENIAFGRVNTIGQSQSFEIYNFGSAPLTVTSISVPEGFEASVSEANVAPKERQEVVVTFSATKAGIYSGNLTCIWVDATGAEQTFTLPVSGILLDTSKWYANFNNPESSTVANWPAGSIYQKNIRVSNRGSYSSFDQYLNSSSSTENMFITPKLHAEANESLSFDAAIYSSNWPEGTIKVYAAATREALADAGTRTELGTFSGENVDDDHLLAVIYRTVSVTVPEAGDYYIGFEISGRAGLDEIYGLSLVDVPHELILEAPEMPATAMQNIAANATLKVLNIGVNDEAADSYSVIAYVNGNAMAIDSTPEIPMVHMLSANPVAIPVTFRSPKAGTFPVYFEVKAGDYTIATEPVDVTFTEELLSGEVLVGKNETTKESFVNFYYKEASGVTIYTPEDLGLTDGDQITGISFRGYMADDNAKDFQLWYMFTDDKELSKPAAGAYSTEGMTQLLNENIKFAKGQSSETNHVDLIKVSLDEPIVYPAGKSMIVMMYAYAAKYQRIYLETASAKGKSYSHGNDYSFSTQEWSECEQPAMYLTLAVSPAALSGKVENVDGTPAAGATVTLVSNDGDNVQYETTTAEDGTYTVNVIQSRRTYNTKASKEDLYDIAAGLTFDTDMTADFTLMPEVNITDGTVALTVSELAHVNVTLTFPEGVNTIALPFSLTADEVRKMFGDNARIHLFDSDDGKNPAPVASFKTHTDGIEAGVPCMIYLPEAVTTDFHATRKEVIAEPQATEGTAIDFVGTFAPMTLEENMVKIDGMDVMFEGENAIQALSATDNAAVTADNTVAPFHAYFRARPGHTVNAVYFLTDSGITTGIDTIRPDGIDGDTIVYDLRGIRVSNPAHGIFIIDGKKVYVK